MKDYTSIFHDTTILEMSKDEITGRIKNHIDTKIDSTRKHCSDTGKEYKDLTREERKKIKDNVRYDMHKNASDNRVYKAQSDAVARMTPDQRIAYYAKKKEIQAKENAEKAKDKEKREELRKKPFKETVMTFHLI